MNLSQVMSMSKESLRIEIAKIQGFTNVHSGDNDTLWGDKFPKGYHAISIPDYPNDIKAAWELEGMIPGEKRVEYSIVLAEIIAEQNPGKKMSLWDTAHSTPHQKSMAYLMTMGAE